MSKHTPGPWIVADHGGPHLAITNATGCHNVALVFGNSVSGEKAHANASLISATTELLEAAEAAIYWLDVKNSGASNIPQPDMALPALMFAVAKARRGEDNG